ncbi:hypothetical protein BH23GEM9_BH23GEM9_28560 [soil metagenome]
MAARRTSSLIVCAWLVLAVGTATHGHSQAAPVPGFPLAAPDHDAVAALVRGLPADVQDSVASAFRILRGPREKNSERTARRTLESLQGTSHAAVGRLGLGLFDAREALDPSSYGKGLGASIDVVMYIAAASPAHYARIHFLAALQSPETVVAAAAALVQIELLVRDHDSMRRVYSALQAVHSPRPEFLRAKLEIANALGDLAAADELRSAEVHTDDGACGDAQLMRARAENMLRRGADDAGVRLYRRAVDCMTAADAERFYADVQLLLTPAERSQWSSGDVATRRAVLNGAWGWRAAQAGVTEPERLAEHFRRLAHIHAAFSFYPPSTTAMGEPGDQVNPQTGLAMGILDQRAQLYLRHGPPDRVISSPPVRTNGTTPSNETWLYSVGGERMVFHLFSSGEKFALGTLPGCGDVGWYDARSEVDRRLPMMGMRCRNPGRGGATMNEMARLDYRQELRSTYAHALATESQRQFRQPMPFFFELYRFAGAAGSTDLVAALALPASSLPQPTTANGAAHYRIGMSLIVMDTLTRAVQRVDTVFSLRSDRVLRTGETLRVHVALPVEPSSHTIYRIVARNPDDATRGEGYGGALDLPAFRLDSLQISDLVLAEPQPTGTWRRGDHQLSLVPFQEFPGGEFDLFYEVYGLAAGARLKTEITLAPVQGGLRGLFRRGDAVEIAFTHEAAAGASRVLQERRRLDASTGPGEYRITVTIRDLDTGSVTTQERTFRITADRTPQQQ